MADENSFLNRPIAEWFFPNPGDGSDYLQELENTPSPGLPNPDAPGPLDVIRAINAQNRQNYNLMVNGTDPYTVVGDVPVVTRPEGSIEDLLSAEQGSPEPKTDGETKAEPQSSSSSEGLTADEIREGVARGAGQTPAWEEEAARQQQQAEAEAKRDAETQKVAQIASGGNPYQFDVTRYMTQPMSYGQTRAMLPAQQVNIPPQAVMARDGKTAYPTDMTDPLYKLRLTNAMLANGAPLKTIQTILGDKALDEKIMDERMNAFRKAITGAPVAERDLQLSKIAQLYPQFASMFGGRTPSLKDNWNLANTIDNLNRTHEWQQQDKQQSHQWDMDKMDKQKALQVEAYREKLGIKDSAEWNNKLATLGLLGQVYGPEQAVRMVFGGTGRSNRSTNSGSGLTKEQKALGESIAYGMDAALQQVAEHDVNASHLSDVRNTLEQAYKDHKISQEYYNNVNNKLYRLEQAWNGGETLSDEEVQALKEELGL